MLLAVLAGYMAVGGGSQWFGFGMAGLGSSIGMCSGGCWGGWGCDWV